MSHGPKKKQLFVMLYVCIFILLILLIFLSIELYNTVGNVYLNNSDQEVSNAEFTLPNLNVIPESVKCPAKKCYFNVSSFANTYSNYTEETLKDLRRFDLVIVEPYNIPNEEYLKEIKKTGTIVIAYLDVGKAENWRYYWKFLDKNIIIKEDKDWEGEYFIDVNDKSWHDAIIEHEIPYILALGDSSNDTNSYHGYDGLMLDNFDVVEDYPEMKMAFYKLVRDISQKYPGLLIIPNRGFDVLPLVYPFIDAIKYEEMCYGYYPESSKYMPRQSIKEQKVLISILKKRNIPVLVLDHVPTHPPNKQAATKCYYDSLVYKQQGHQFAWNANSADQDLYMWDFLKIK